MGVCLIRLTAKGIIMASCVVKLAIGFRNLWGSNIKKFDKSWSLTNSS